MKAWYGVHRRNAVCSQPLCDSRLVMWIVIFFLMLVVGCSVPTLENAVLGDIRPPVIKDAKLSNEKEFVIEFDEPVSVRADAFSVRPDSLTSCAESSGSTVAIRFDPSPSPGEDVVLGGSVQDLVGNSTRIQVQFKGYNNHPAGLVLSEIQTAKNTSKRAPHRDYIEFYIERAGNLGGMFVRWASATKVMRYDFPPCEVAAGEVVVLHCAPEGVPDEVDELGSDLSRSGGIDATATGRDLWTSAGGIPDASGAVAVYSREGEPPIDGVFYAESEKTGAMDSSKLSALAQELADAGIWEFDASLTWDRALHWKPSTSRSLVRRSFAQKGAAAWAVGESGGQNPGIVIR